MVKPRTSGSVNARPSRGSAYARLAHLGQDPAAMLLEKDAFRWK